MTKNTTATGSTIDGVTVVHPDNIGKGIKWDEATQKYQVALGDGLYIDDSGNVAIKISTLEDNMVRVKDGAIYQGSVPDVGAYFVDAVNGNDANDGTSHATAVRTIYAALDKIKRGTNVNIFLRENQTHDVLSNPKYIYANVTFSPYGPELEALEAVWKSAETGWDPVAAKEYVNKRPIINVIPSYVIPSDPTKFSSLAFFVMSGYRISYSGIHFKIDLSKQLTYHNGWRGIFAGYGFIEFVDCTFDNRNFRSQLAYILTDLGVNLTARLVAPYLLSEAPEDAIFFVTTKLQVTVEESNESPHSNLSGVTGLHWFGTTRKNVVLSSVYNAGPATTVSKNFITN